jgi:hypothetical protein
VGEELSRLSDITLVDSEHCRQRNSGTGDPQRDSRLVAGESDGSAFLPLGQAERCRRLARATDASLRDSLLKLAEEYTARASALENDGTAIWQADADDQGAE